MNNMVIRTLCGSCRAWVRMQDVLFDPISGINDRCPECGGYLIGDRPETAQLPCDACGTIIDWPASDDITRGVMCSPCVTRLVAETWAS